LPFIGQDGPIQPAQQPHHGICIFTVKLPAKEQRAQHRDECDGDDGRSQDGKRLREGQRAESRLNSTTT